MQIWRMKPDGSGKEQITYDEYHNWFPHISPDGKWMVLISFPPNIDPADHPFYKRVLLRLMPLTTVGAPRVIAYLYGGRGPLMCRRGRRMGSILRLCRIIKTA
jgi:TolB protein